MDLGKYSWGLSFTYGMLVEAVISAWGWRPSFLVMAGLLLTVLLPLYLLYYHFRLVDRGLKTEGREQIAVDIPVIKNVDAGMI